MGLKGEALPALFHDEGGDAPGADVRRGDGEDHIGVRLAAVGDEDLLAVQQPVVALVLGGGLGAAGVGACVGLGQAEGAHLFAGAQVGQVFHLLLLGAEGVDGVGAQRRVGGEDDAGAAVHPAQLLHGDGVAEGVQSGAAVLGLIGDTHKAQLAHFRHSLPGEAVFLVQHERDGLDFRLREGTDLLAQSLVGFRGLIEHKIPSSFFV